MAVSLDGLKVALDDVPIEIDDHHRLRLKLVVRHAAWLDDHDALLAVDAADVPPRQRHQAGARQLAVAPADLLLQCIERHHISRQTRFRAASPQVRLF